MEAKGKIGLDDYLIKHSADELNQLPVHEIKNLTIDEMIEKATPDIGPDELKSIINRIADINNESTKSQYINRLHKKTKISKRAITKDIQMYTQQNSSEGEFEHECKPVLCANFPGLIDVVTDDTDEDGKTQFLVKVNSEIDLVNEWEHGSDEIYVPPSKEILPFELPRASKVMEWYQSDDDMQLFKDVMDYFKRFSYLPDEQWLIVVCNVFLSYIQDHDEVHYLPMLLFFAVPERGKSKTGKAMTYVCFRGIHVVELREANLFRYSENMKATLFFDIMDLWKKAESGSAVDILLLRYEKGATVSRVLYPDKGAFEDTAHYSIYGPTILATNEAIHKILDTRCIPITMPNKPGSYENPNPEKAQELKERLTAWRARVIDKPLPKIETMSGISGRLWDISRPMVQVCQLVYPEKLHELVNALSEVAKQKTEDKKIGIEGQIITELYELSPQEENVHEWTIWTRELLELLNKNRPDEQKLKPQYLGRKLKAIGINTRKVKGYSEIQLNKAEFDILLIQYGIIDTNHLEETLPNSTTLSSHDISNTCTGRESVESPGTTTNSLPTQDIEDKEVRSLVDSGRELQDGKGGKNEDDGIVNLENEEVEIIE